MKRLATTACALALLVLVGGPVSAQDEPSPATLNFHATSAGYAGCGLFNDVDGTCEGINPVYPGGNSFLWVIAAGIPLRTGDGEEQTGGVGGVQFGIDYEGIPDFEDFSLCTGGNDIATDLWPAPGEGIAITWDGGCYDPMLTNPEGFAKVGYFFLGEGGPGEVRIIEDPRISVIRIADCGANLFRICPQATGRFNTEAGGSAEVVCGFICSVPVEESSWGGIKSKFQ